MPTAADDDYVVVGPGRRGSPGAALAPPGQCVARERNCGVAVLHGCSYAAVPGRTASECEVSTANQASAASSAQMKPMKNAAFQAP